MDGLGGPKLGCLRVVGLNPGRSPGVPHLVPFLAHPGIGGVKAYGHSRKANLSDPPQNDAAVLAQVLLRFARVRFLPPTTHPKASGVAKGDMSLDTRAALIAAEAKLPEEVVAWLVSDGINDVEDIASIAYDEKSCEERSVDKAFTEGVKVLDTTGAKIAVRKFWKNAEPRCKPMKKRQRRQRWLRHLWRRAINW